MNVRACFYCESVKEMATHNPDDTICIEVVLKAVISGKADDNKDWSKYTPQGEMKMLITNPACRGQFVPGRQYYLDMTAVVAMKEAA